MLMRVMMLGALGVLAMAAPATARDRFAATIERTTYGIPHITAANWAGLGYGTAYAYAQDNLCLLAEEFVTIAGERSRHFGPANSAVLGFGEVENLASDVFFRATIDLAPLRRGLRRQPAAVRDLLRGYVAGYNRALRDLGPQGVPGECRGKAWVRPITIDDMLRINEKQMLLASSLALAPAIASAAPPGAAPAVSLRRAPVLPHSGELGLGSNGWAFGAEATGTAAGLVVGNPHFPWNGPSRFYQMHQTIPGVYDVMGVGLAGTPMVSLGFNRDVAWTHTVTEARHFTLFQLELDPADPTVYRVDGRREAMRRLTVTVPMPDGTPAVTRTLYATRYGPVISMPSAFMGWTASRAFALRDANRGNQRGAATWIRIGQARSVGEIRDAVSQTLGIPWVNTIAADRAGNALHADITAVPNVSAAKIAACATPLSPMVASRATLLDGSKAVCDWDVAPGTPERGLMPASDQALYERRDFVANSNDSYWLSNPAAPFRALSPILGAHSTARTLRTRSGLVEIARRLSGADGLPGNRVTLETAQAMVFANRSLAAELTVDPMLALCVGRAEIADACAVLRAWDRRFEVESRGAYLFHEFWRRARALTGVWNVPFNPADPVNTPRGFATDGRRAPALAAALKAAADDLRTRRIALDARWGDVQFAVRGTERIAVHGGSGANGILNLQESRVVPGGLIPMHGSSYVQIVTFDANGPIADAVLSYSQSTNPASPHFGDQTRAYSSKTWQRLPFRREQIAAARIAPPLTIRE